MVISFFTLLVTLFMIQSRIVLAGVALGLMYMVHNQALFLAVACVLSLLIQRPFKQSLKKTCLLTMVTLIVALPLFVRNISLWGDPFFQCATPYTYEKMGIPSYWTLVDGDFVLNFKLDSVSLVDMFSKSIRAYVDKL